MAAICSDKGIISTKPYKGITTVKAGIKKSINVSIVLDSKNDIPAINTIEKKYMVIKIKYFLLLLLP